MFSLCFIFPLFYSLVGAEESNGSEYETNVELLANGEIINIHKTNLIYSALL